MAMWAQLSEDLRLEFSTLVLVTILHLQNYKPHLQALNAKVIDGERIVQVS